MELKEEDKVTEWKAGDVQATTAETAMMKGVSIVSGFAGVALLAGILMDSTGLTVSGAAILGILSPLQALAATSYWKNRKKNKM